MSRRQRQAARAIAVDAAEQFVRDGRCITALVDYEAEPSADQLRALAADLQAVDRFGVAARAAMLRARGWTRL